VDVAVAWQRWPVQVFGFAQRRWSAVLNKDSSSEDDAVDTGEINGDGARIPTVLELLLGTTTATATSSDGSEAVPGTSPLAGGQPRGITFEEFVSNFTELFRPDGSPAPIPAPLQAHLEVLHRRKAVATHERDKLRGEADGFKRALEEKDAQLARMIAEVGAIV
jgi:hypothetical protein